MTFRYFILVSNQFYIIIENLMDSIFNPGYLISKFIFSFDNLKL